MIAQKSDGHTKHWWSRSRQSPMECCRYERWPWRPMRMDLQRFWRHIMTTAYVTPYWQFKFIQDVQTINGYVFDNERENADYIVLFRSSDSSFEMKLKKNKKRNICHSLFIWLFCYYLLFFYLEFTNNKCMKQMNQLASLWTLGESLLHVVNNKFLFKSKIITKRTIYLIWKIYLKSRSNIFIIQNVPFCL